MLPPIVPVPPLSCVRTLRHYHGRWNTTARRSPPSTPFERHRSLTTPATSEMQRDNGDGTIANNPARSETMEAMRERERGMTRTERCNGDNDRDVIVNNSATRPTTRTWTRARATRARGGRGPGPHDTSTYLKSHVHDPRKVVSHILMSHCPPMRLVIADRTSR